MKRQLLESLEGGRQELRRKITELEYILLRENSAFSSEQRRAHAKMYSRLGDPRSHTKAKPGLAKALKKAATSKGMKMRIWTPDAE